MSENPLLFEKKASSGYGTLSFVETTDGSGIAVRLMMAYGSSTVCVSAVLRAPEAEILSASLSSWCAKKQRREIE